MCCDLKLELLGPPTSLNSSPCNFATKPYNTILAIQIDCFYTEVHDNVTS